MSTPINSPAHILRQTISLAEDAIDALDALNAPELKLALARALAPARNWEGPYSDDNAADAATDAANAARHDATLAYLEYQAGRGRDACRCEYGARTAVVAALDCVTAAEDDSETEAMCELGRAIDALKMARGETS